MIQFATRALAVCIALLIALGARGQGAAISPYQDLTLSPQARAADLVHRMTLQEKASQLVNQARAIPRLGIPAYDWWSESLHGVAVNGTTEFPEPIGLAATFDVPGIHDMATAIGVEGRIKHVQAERDGHSNIFEGLDFWAPNVNIFRDPRWGRGQETYGEDPFLSGRMAVAFVTGMQGTDPKYYRVISTPKHFAVHSGPEPTRHFADVDVSRHDEEDTYLPAFRAAVVEGHAGIGHVRVQRHQWPAGLRQRVFAGAHAARRVAIPRLCGLRLRRRARCRSGHHYRPSQPQASAIALQHGMDNECIDFFERSRTTTTTIPTSRPCSRAICRSTPSTPLWCACSRHASGWACSTRRKRCRIRSSMRPSSTVRRTAPCAPPGQ